MTAESKVAHGRFKGTYEIVEVLQSDAGPTNKLRLVHKCISMVQLCELLADCRAASCSAYIPHGCTQGLVLGPNLCRPTKSEQASGGVACLSPDAVRTREYTQRLSATEPSKVVAQGTIQKVAGQIEWSDSTVTGSS